MLICSLWSVIAALLRLCGVVFGCGLLFNFMVYCGVVFGYVWVVVVRLFGWLEVWLLLCFYLVGGLIGFGISAVAALELLCWFVVLVAVGDLWL